MMLIFFNRSKFFFHLYNCGLIWKAIVYDPRFNEVLGFYVELFNGVLGFNVELLLR